MLPRLLLSSSSAAAAGIRRAAMASRTRLTSTAAVASRRSLSFSSSSSSSPLLLTRLRLHRPPPLSSSSLGFNKSPPARSVVSNHGPNPHLRGGSGGGGGGHRQQQYQHYPPPGRQGMPTYMKVTLVVFGGGVVAYLSTYEQAPNTGRWRPMPISPATEKELGVASQRAILQKFAGKVLPPDKPIVQLVKKVGRRLVAVSGTEGLQWEFHVIDDDKVMNAAAMPGGKVVVFTGLRQCVTTEEELAAVLGHEIAHVVQRHSAEAMAKTAAMHYLFIFLALLGLPVNELTLLLGDLTVAKPNSRAHEMEADEVGVLLCAKAGYDPSAAIRVFQRMQGVETEMQKAGAMVKFPAFLSTHPDFPQRIASLTEKAVQARPIYESVRAEQLARQSGWGGIYISGSDSGGDSF